MIKSGRLIMAKQFLQYSSIVPKKITASFALMFSVLVLVSAKPCLGADSFKAASVWEAYKNNFIQGDGRVIDTYQKDFSHSEAQAYGLLLALKFNEKELFGKIAHWIRDNLQVRKGDRLICWAWGKRPVGAWQVKDYNNASDADVLTAWALLQAGRKWNIPEYTDNALALIRDIRNFLFIKYQNRNVLLPGYSGFIKSENNFEYNPSYFIPLAFRDFINAGDDPEFWKTALKDGLWMQKKSLFGRFALPANWVRVSASGLKPSRSSKYGYDAIRVLLYTVEWLESEKSQHLNGEVNVEGLKKLFEISQPDRWIPAEVRLQDDFISPDDAPAGFFMVYSRLMELTGNHQLAKQLKQRALVKINEEKSNYYSCSLFLLALKQAY